MTTGAAILARLEAAGLHLRAEGGNIHARPREAVTDELRALMRAHKPELLQLIGKRGAGAQPAKPAPAKVEPDHDPLPEPAPSPLSGYDCMACDRLTMTEEIQPGTRRRFFWRCREGFEVLQARNYGERVVLAPPECNKFTAWKAGTR